MLKIGDRFKDMTTGKIYIIKTEIDNGTLFLEGEICARDRKEKTKVDVWWKGLLMSTIGGRPYDLSSRPANCF